MKISIITICKNEKNTIEETFLSVFNQTYKNIEYIVIDGVSTDGTLDIIQKYKEKISYFSSEPDTGIYNALNKGIKIATGDILYFLNANDMLNSNDIFEKIVYHFKNDNELDFVFGNVQFIDENRQECGIFNSNCFKTIFSFKKACINHQSIFYRSNVFNRFGLYNETYKTNADYDFNLRLLMANGLKAKYLDTTIGRYQLGGLSCTNNDGNANYIFNLHFIELTKKHKWIKIAYKIDEIINEAKNNDICFKIDKFLSKFFRSPYKFIKKRLNIINFIMHLYPIKLNLS